MPAGISPLAIHESGYYLHADFSFEFGSHLHEFSFCYTVNSWVSADQYLISFRFFTVRFLLLAVQVWGPTCRKEGWFYHLCLCLLASMIVMLFISSSEIGLTTCSTGSLSPPLNECISLISSSNLLFCLSTCWNQAADQNRTEERRGREKQRARHKQREWQYERKTDSKWDREREKTYFGSID